MELNKKNKVIAVILFAFIFLMAVVFLINYSLNKEIEKFIEFNKEEERLKELIIQKQIEELNTLREENFVSLTREDIQKQIEELEVLRKNQD